MNQFQPVAKAIEKMHPKQIPQISQDTEASKLKTERWISRAMFSGSISSLASSGPMKLPTQRQMHGGCGCTNAAGRDKNPRSPELNVNANAIVACNEKLRDINRMCEGEGTNHLRANA